MSEKPSGPPATLADLDALTAEIEQLRSRLARAEESIFDAQKLEKMNRRYAAVLKLKSEELAAEVLKLQPLTKEVESLRTRASEMEAYAQQAEQELISARRQPHRVLAKLAHYRLLKILSKAWPLLPSRMVSRFGRSAEKRDPRRPVRFINSSGHQNQLEAKLPIPVVSAVKRLLDETTQRLLPRFETPASRDRAGSVTGNVTISVLLPVYETPLALLRRCIETVLFQSWANWELCVVNDASPSPLVQLILDDYAAMDSRVRVVELEKNRGIAGATQVALEAATGSHVALLDHDDELTVDALERMAAAISSAPKAGVFYSDECKLSPDGEPLEVFAKPDWSPAMAINCMYLGHLTVYRRDLLLEVGGFRSKFDFSQDYDLALRVTEIAEGVVHVPEILYGWRTIPQSAAAGGKPFARETNVAALQSAADRRGWKAKAVAGTYANELHWEIDKYQPMLSLIIPSDNRKMIEEAIKSIDEISIYENYEIVIVTNSSLIAELSSSKQPSTVKMTAYDKPFNFSDKCNVGAATARGDIFVFYNDDVRVITPDWMARISDGFRLEGVGAVGSKLLYENGLIQHAGMLTGVRRLVGTAFHMLPEMASAYFNFAQSLREVSLLCGALLAVRRDVFEQVAGFDAQNTPIYHSDVDLCFKIREAGKTCLYTPYATLLHIGHVSIGAEKRNAKKIEQEKAAVWLLKRWPEQIAYDPYFPTMMRDLCYHDSPDPFSVFPGRRVTDHNAGDVLLVSHDLTASGAPRVVLEMARALQANGWFVVVAAPSDGPMRDELNALGITVIIDPLLFHHHPTVRDLAKDYDLVICNTIVSWTLVAQIKDVVPTVMYVHEIVLVNDLANDNGSIRRLLAEAEYVWAGSKLCAENLRRYRKNVTVLEYGLDRSQPTTNVAAKSRSSTRLSVFASFEPRKGQDLLAEAYAALTDEERSNVGLYFYGRTLDQVLRDAVVAGFGEVEGIHFEGELSHEDYLAALSASDMVVVPSRSDTLPLVSLNALGAGVPLMCTAQTGTAAYLVDGVSGYIIPSTDIPAMTAALRRAISQRDRWESIGAQGALVFDRHFGREAFQKRLVEMAARISGRSLVRAAK